MSRKRHVKVWQDCPECGGEGWKDCNDGIGDTNLDYTIIGREECEICHGSGRIEAEAPEPEFEKDDNY